MTTFTIYGTISEISEKLIKFEKDYGDNLSTGNCEVILRRINFRDFQYAGEVTIAISLRADEIKSLTL